MMALARAFHADGKTDVATICRTLGIPRATLYRYLQPMIRCRRPNAASSAQRTKTLVHEAAHWLADHRGSVARSDAETVAESGAFVVLARFGIDAGAYTFPYVARWAQDKAVLKRNLTEVQGVAAGLIAGIEAATLAE